MFILSYCGGSRYFGKLGSSFCYSVHKDPGSRFHNPTFGAFIKTEKMISKKYRHTLFLDNTSKKPLEYSLGQTASATGLGVFTPHYMKIQYLDRQSMRGLFSCGLAFSSDYVVRGSDFKLVHPFLKTYNEETYIDLCRVIREAQEEYMKKLPDTYKMGIRVPKGVASPFYVLQFRAKKEIEVMFFIGGAVDGNE